MRKISIPFLLALLATLSTTMAISAHAHEYREIAEKYAPTVGVAIEPAFVNEVNGLDLRIAEHQSGKPVADLEKTLKTEVSYGGRAMPNELRAKFGILGSYVAQFIRTKVGGYTFRVFGTIEGGQVD